jgi:hypothetical protein
MGGSWTKSNGRGCEDCPSPAAWCRACMAEADRDRTFAELQEEVRNREQWAKRRDAVAADRDRLAANATEYMTQLAVSRAELMAALAERDSARSELERMRPVYEAARHLCSRHVGGAFLYDGIRVDARNRLHRVTEAAVKSDPDDWDRCAVCGWDLAEKIEDGCTRGNCSHRPRPERLYSPRRAEQERSSLLPKAGDE